MIAATQHWALTDEELIRLLDDALPHIAPEHRPLVMEILGRFQMLTLEKDDLK